MTSTPITTLASDRDFASRPTVTRAGWAWIAGFAALFFAVFNVILVKSTQFALNDADWSHALIVPLISLYFIHQHRAELAAAPKRVCWWGLPILFIGLIGHAFWIYPGQNHMFQGYSMILALFGLVLFVLGWRAMGILWLPILYLGFAIKVSDKIWEIIALKLQLIAAKGASALINFFGAAIDLEATVRGSIIQLIYKGKALDPMEVAQACAGLRMLMAFIALGVAVAFLAKRPWWQRVIVIGSTVPIAVGINVVRVTVLGFIYPYDKELASGDFHTLVGMLMLIPAAGLFLLTGWIMDQVFVIDEDAQASKRAAKAEKQASRGGAVAERSGADGDRDPADAGVPKAATRAGWGLGLGVLTTLGLGGAYTLFLAWYRPDLFELLTPHAALAGAVGLTLVGVGLATGLKPVLKRAGPPGGRRRRWMALGVAGGVLLTTWLGQSGVVAATQAVMFKEPVPLRHQLFRLPQTLGSWELFRKDPPLPDEVVKTLGTDQYVSMIYEDLDWPEDRPGRFVRLHVPYYTGMIDTVPHVAERCFVGGGMQLMGSDFVNLELPYLGAEPDPESDNLRVPTRLGPPASARVPSDDFTARQVTFADPTNPTDTFHVVYFFIANGKFMSTAEAVRVEGFNITDRYSFYCKVEVQVLGVRDREVAEERAESLLTVMLPEIMTALPDWVEVRAGSYPETGETSETRGARPEPDTAPRGESN